MVVHQPFSSRVIVVILVQCLTLFSNDNNYTSVGTSPIDLFIVRSFSLLLLPFPLLLFLVIFFSPSFSCVSLPLLSTRFHQNMSEMRLYWSKPHTAVFLLIKPSSANLRPYLTSLLNDRHTSHQITGMVNSRGPVDHYRISSNCI